MDIRVLKLEKERTPGVMLTTSYPVCQQVKENMDINVICPTWHEKAKLRQNVNGVKDVLERLQMMITSRTPSSRLETKLHVSQQSIGSRPKKANEKKKPG